MWPAVLDQPRKHAAISSFLRNNETPVSRREFTRSRECLMVPVKLNACARKVTRR